MTKADQDLFREIVLERLRARGWKQVELANATGVPHDQQLLSAFLNRRKSVGPDVAKRWARELGIPRREVPASIAWPITPEVEVRETLTPYLERLSGLDRLPYHTVLQSMLGRHRSPPDLTRVYVRPEYRTSTDAPRTKGGALPRLQQELGEALSAHQHAILQGAPGSGKSSVALHLAKTLADALLKGTYENGWVPVPVIAREFLDRSRSESFESALSASIRLRFGEELPAYAFSKAPSFRQGKWLVIFDGLDEIVEPSTRAELILRINDRAKSSKSPYKFLVTSRPMAELSHLGPQFARFVLLPFAEIQVNEFVRKWFDAVSGDNAAIMSKGFRDWLKAGRIGDITTSPAMLTIAAIVYQYSDGRLPNNRVELYNAYADMMLARKVRGRPYEEARSLGSAMRSALAEKSQYGESGRSLANNLVAMQREFFSECAYRLQSQSEIDFVALAIEKVQKAQWFSGIPEDIQADGDLMKPWVEELLRASGVVQENLNGFTFVHNTMREYLAAAHLFQALRDEEQKVAFVRLWSEARWREIVLFFLSLVSRSPEGSDWVSAQLRTILASGPRGVHFAGTALAEGVLVDEGTATAIVDGVIVRAKSWNLCSELFSEFASPDVTEVLRMLAQHPRVRQTLVTYLRKGGIGCPKSLRAIFDFTEDIANVDELEDLAKNGSALWVRVGALTGLLRRGEIDRAGPLIQAAVSRLGVHYGIDIVLALSSCRSYDDLSWIANCEQVAGLVRLSALLCLDDSAFARSERLLRIESLSQKVDNWEPLTGDILVRLATTESLQILLSSKNLARGLGLSFCSALIDAGHESSVLEYLELVLLSGTLKERSGAAQLLARTSKPAATLLPQVQALCRQATTDFREFVDLAELCAVMGDSRFLKQALQAEALSGPERCRAAVSYANHDPKFRESAFDTLRQMAKASNRERDFDALVDAALTIDSSEVTVKEILSWLAGEVKYDSRGLSSFHKLRDSRALCLAVSDERMSYGQREYAVRALRDLGEGDSIHRLFQLPNLDFSLKLACARELAALGWAKEVKTWALEASQTQSAERKLSVLENQALFGLGDAARPLLSEIRDDCDARPVDRLRAARALGGVPWKEVPSLELVCWLLEDEHPVDCRIEALDWIVGQLAQFDEHIQAHVKLRSDEAAISLLSNGELPSTLRTRVSAIVRDRFWDVSPPVTIAKLLIDLSEQVDLNLLSWLNRHREEVDLVETVLLKWSTLALDSSQRLTLVGMMLDSGLSQFAVRELNGIEVGGLSPDSLFHFAMLLNRCNCRDEASGILHELINQKGAIENLRLEAICSLFEWGVISARSACSLADVVIGRGTRGDAKVALAYLRLAEIGANPDSYSVFFEALSAGSLTSAGNIRICRVLVETAERVRVLRFLKASVDDERLTYSLPACAFLMIHFPEEVTLETVKRALSAFGTFELTDLVEVCAAAEFCTEATAILDEVLSFISYCDMNSKELQKFGKDLSKLGLRNLARRFAHWLTDVGIDELVHDWGLSLDEAQEFLGNSEEGSN